MSFFQKIKELFDKPEAAVSHDDWFYHTKIFSKKIIFFYRHIQQQQALNNVIKTGQSIIPPELNFGISTEQVVNTWGKPRCRFFHKNGNKNIEILFYRRSYVYENTLFQLQFFNNELFFAGIEVGKSLTSNETKIKMLANFLPAFITENFIRFDALPIWTDVDKNYLFIEDEVNTNICFVNGSYAFDKLPILEQELLQAVI